MKINGPVLNGPSARSDFRITKLICAMSELLVRWMYRIIAPRHPRGMGRDTCSPGRAKRDALDTHPRNGAMESLLLYAQKCFREYTAFYSEFPDGFVQMPVLNHDVLAFIGCKESCFAQQFFRCQARREAAIPFSDVFLPPIICCAVEQIRSFAAQFFR